MKRFSCVVLFSFLVGAAAPGQDTVIWPLSPAAPPTSSAVTPIPQLGWFMHFKFNLDSSQKMSKVDLIFDGDSITDFWMSKARDLWNQRYAKLNAYDFGISGDRTENLLWRLQHGQADTLHPKLIALMIGTNNLAVNTPDEIAAGVKADIDEYFRRCPEAVILLQAVFPRGEKPTEPVRGKVKALNDLISKFGDGKKVIYVDFGDKFLQPDGTLSKDIMPDFLHPSAAGYQIWADAIQPQIDQIFGKSSP